MDSNQQTVVYYIIARKKIAVFSKRVQESIGLRGTEFQFEMVVYRIFILKSNGGIPK